jgi:hypothetical protein
VSNYGELQVANSLVYGNYKNTPGLSETIRILSKAIPILRGMMKVDPRLEIVLRPIKSRRYVGLHFQTSSGGFIEVDPRRAGVAQCLETLCHEFVHAEQWFTGKMKQTMSRELRQWEDRTVNMAYTAYLDLPWEVEARQRQKALADAVMAKINGRAF